MIHENHDTFCKFFKLHVLHCSVLISGWHSLDLPRVH